MPYLLHKSRCTHRLFRILLCRQVLCYISSHQSHLIICEAPPNCLPFQHKLITDIETSMSTFANFSRTRVPVWIILFVAHSQTSQGILGNWSWHHFTEQVLQSSWQLPPWVNYKELLDQRHRPNILHIFPRKIRNCSCHGLLEQQHLFLIF